MKSFYYRSGEEVITGDRIRYRAEDGSVSFVVNDRTGDPAIDWYLEEYSGGGLMIEVSNMGCVFVDASEIGGDLVFVSRKR